MLNLWMITAKTGLDERKLDHCDVIRQGLYSDFRKKTVVPWSSDALLRRHLADIALRHKMSSVKMTPITHPVSKWI